MNSPVVPPLLHEGSRVALVAPARWVTEAEVASAVALLRAWKLEPVVPDGLFAACHQMAGDDAHRTRLLQQAVDDPTLDALWCVRGGYGSVRVVDGLRLDSLRRRPKWIVGYSDATVLHSHIQAQACVATVHGTMPINVPPDAADGSYPALESLHQLLFEGAVSYRFVSPRFRPGRASAPVVGGNLSVLYSLLGSPSDVDWTGKILFLEDLDEYLYHIDRMMQALRRAGKLESLAALVVGALSDMHDNAVPFGRTAEEIVWEAVSSYDYPVCFAFPAGHIGMDNCAFPLGQPVMLRVDERGQTRLETL
ncbi:MAG: LD-carboxypeptidase [Bacteroidales bacterium]|nr:LD-carboxypeptidase [Bacteroidales bacterium]